MLSLLLEQLHIQCFKSLLRGKKKKLANAKTTFFSKTLREACND